MKSVIIKRYSNRKLYDTDAKKFITLNDIANLLNMGKDVKVVDKDTGKDVTSHVLAVLLQKHYDHGKKLLNIPDESPLELIRNRVKLLKIKRALEVVYRLVTLNSTDKEALNHVIDELVKEGVVNEEMAIETVQTLWNLLKERDVEVEQKIRKKLKLDEACEKLRAENERLKAEIEKLRANKH